jgi:hypothetical protein
MWILGENGTDINVLITPYLPVIGIVAGSILVGAFSVFNRKRGSIETRAPDVNEIWLQQAEQSKELDSERRVRRKLEDYSRELLIVFRAYVKRVQGGGPITLTSREHRLLEGDNPTGEAEPHHP